MAATSRVVAIAIIANGSLRGFCGAGVADDARPDPSRACGTERRRSGKPCRGLARCRRRVLQLVSRGRGDALASPSGSVSARALRTERSGRNRRRGPGLTCRSARAATRSVRGPNLGQRALLWFGPTVRRVESLADALAAHQAVNASPRNSLSLSLCHSRSGNGRRAPTWRTPSANRSCVTPRTACSSPGKTRSPEPRDGRS